MNVMLCIRFVRAPRTVAVRVNQLVRHAFETCKYASVINGWHHVYVYLCADYVSSEASLTVHTPATHFGTAPARVSLTEGSIGPGPASMVRYCSLGCEQDFAISAPRALHREHGLLDCSKAADRGN